MPRRPRVVLEGGICHVHDRFARDAEIFREGADVSRRVRWGLARRQRDTEFREAYDRLGETLPHSRSGTVYRFENVGPGTQTGTRQGSGRPGTPTPILITEGPAPPFWRKAKLVK